MAAAKRPAQQRGLRPAQPGNRQAVRHGAHAEPPPTAVAAKEQELYQFIEATAPVRLPDGGLPPADQVLVRLLARTLVRLESVNAWIDAHGVLDRRGKARSVLRHERRLTNEAVAYLRELGMTPRSRFQMGRDLAATVDLAQALSEPDPTKRKELLQRAGVDTEGG